MNRKVIFLILLAGALYFFKLGSFSLYDAIEALYGEYTKQILLTGDWLTQRFNGQIIFDKPPLYFWLTALISLPLGLNEFTIRFWTALAGVLTVFTTYKLGKTFYNEQVGFNSGLIVMTAFQFLIQSRIAELDSLLTLLISSSLLFFWQRKYYLMYITMGLGTLLKGIIGAVLPGFAIFLFLLLSKDLKRLKEMKIPTGLTTYVLIAFPWYLIEYLKHGQTFLDFAVGFLFLARFQGVVANHTGPWYYYFLAIILGFAPWSHYLPLAIKHAWQDRKSSPVLMFFSFSVPTFLVFSIAQTKLPSYLLPLYPFLAIMVGKLWFDFLGQEQKELRQGMLFANLALGVVVTMILAGFIILGNQNYTNQYLELLPHLQLLAGILIGGSLVSIMEFLKKDYQSSFWALPITVFLITIVLTTRTLPAIEYYKGTKVLAQKVTKVLKAKDQIAAYNTGNRPSIVYYNSKPVVVLNNLQELESFLLYQDGYIFTTKEEAKSLKIGKVFAEQGDLVVLR